VAETKTDLKKTETRLGDLEHLAAIHFKGITQTLQALSRPPAFTTPPNENADIARTFGNIPLHGSTNSRSIVFSCTRLPVKDFMEGGGHDQRLESGRLL
jgi:hypothetical protein